MLRVVHDTNVVVSALLFRAGRLAWLRDAWAGGAVVPVICRSTIAELERVLFYPKFDLDADEVTALLAAYMEHAETRPNPGAAVRVPRCRDEDDRLFLRLGYTASAGAIVTGDADLIALASKSRVRIVTPAALRALIDPRRDSLEEARAAYRVERTIQVPRFEVASAGAK